MARPRITPGNTRRAIGIARIVLPALAPLAIRAAGYARHRWDTARARRLGLAVDGLPALSGRGTVLHARLARLASALPELADRRPAEADFVAGAQSRLADLVTAMRAAELMAPPRRRSAHRAVSAELDRIEDGLLRRLNV